MMVGIHHSKGAGLPLPQELEDEYLTFECPRCERAIVRKGIWFKTISSFKCLSCKAAVRLGYAEKLHLFEKHRHLIATRQTDDVKASPAGADGR
ncbi:hypothetical protein FJ414_21395 [Mesorhizobium sp. B3-1-6]|nr:hypothetical protein FJ414_21395 [Mesorhizobium sp. B3-1-6]TPI57675.1 hypothetical protein FJ417_21460 [Mesorhizobium sp. B3-1-7]TPJ36985.1 hypothetical protein FJ418_01535 [Mesorhizobium sp. B2-8-3]